MSEPTFEIQFTVTFRGVGKPDRKIIEENLQDAVRNQHLNAGWTAVDDEDSMVTGYEVEFIYE